MIHFVVAVHHGNAGAFPKRVAGQRLLKGFGPILVTLWLSGGLFGFWLANWNVPLVAALAAVGTCLLYGSTQFLMRNLEANEKERLRYARGFEGELLVSWTLDALGTDWHIFHGLQLTEREDFDHVVVGPRGLFYIQTKNRRGLIARSDDTLVLNGVPDKVTSTVRSQAMELKRRLADETGTPVRWIKAVVVVPFASIDLDNDVTNVAVVDQEGMVPYIERQRQEFDQAQIESYVAALSRLAAKRPLARRWRPR
jgi:hypothetical protein